MTLDEAINKNIKMAELQERLLSNADDSLKEIVMKYATEYRQLAEWLRELKERRSGGWISCKDRMPEDNDRVLILAKNESVYIAKHRVFGHFVVSFEYWLDDTEVTHWMPLPEPPKDGEQDD